MQCKDIPIRPILEFIQDRNDNDRDRYGARWCNWVFGDAYDVHTAMPEGIPDKLLIAKMGKLIRSGLIDGCDCGCRGDFRITLKGREFLISDGKPIIPNDQL
jgi:hypothetical protein